MADFDIYYVNNLPIYQIYLPNLPSYSIYNSNNFYLFIYLIIVMRTIYIKYEMHRVYDKIFITILLLYVLLYDLYLNIY